MQRYSAAIFPQDYESFGFDEQWVTAYSHEIDFTTQTFDEFFGRIVAFVDRNPEFQFWVSISMSQQATFALPLKTRLYVVDMARLTSALGVSADQWRSMPAMRPQYNVLVDASLQSGFEDTLRSHEVDGQPLSWRQSGSGFYSLDFGHTNAYFRNIAPQSRGEAKSLQDLGLDNGKIDDRSGTTAYLMPQESLLILDLADRTEKRGRQTISSLDITPAILSHFGVPTPSYMKTPIAT